MICGWHCLEENIGKGGVHCQCLLVTFCCGRVWLTSSCNHCCQCMLLSRAHLEPQAGRVQRHWNTSPMKGRHRHSEVQHKTVDWLWWVQVSDVAGHNNIIGEKETQSGIGSWGFPDWLGSRRESCLHVCKLGLGLLCIGCKGITALQLQFYGRLSSIVVAFEMSPSNPFSCISCSGLSVHWVTL